MDHTASRVPEPIDPASLLGIPEELKILLLQYVPAADRRTLRLACWELSDYIDEYVGPSDWLCGLHDKASMDQISFYACTYFPRVRISKRCLFDAFQNMLYRPRNITAICLMETGSLNADFFIDLLQKAKGRLQYLKLNGIINMSIPQEDEMICLPRLKFLCVDLKHLYNDINFGTQPADPSQIIPEWERAEEVASRSWGNGLTLLRSLSAPTCAEISWTLCFRRNAAAENFDEIEQAQAFFDFLSRHRSCKSLKIHSRINHTYCMRRIMTPRHSYFYQRAKALGAEDPIRGPAGVRIPSGDFGIRELSYRQDWLPTHLDSHLYEFMLSLNGLERLNLNVHRFQLPEVVIMMDAVHRIILKNQNTLTTLVLAVIQKEEFVDFQLFSNCTALQAICLHISMDSLTGMSTIRNFGPSQNMIDNLTALVLTYCGFEAKDLKSLPKLKKLKHLALLYDMRIIPLEDVVAILLMRSLEGLVISLHLIRLDAGAGANTGIGDWKLWNDAGEQGNEPWALTMRQVFFPLRHFLRTRWLYISDRKTPFWRMDTRSYQQNIRTRTLLNYVFSANQNIDYEHITFTAPGDISDPR